MGGVGAGPGRGAGAGRPGRGGADQEVGGLSPPTLLQALQFTPRPMAPETPQVWLLRVSSPCFPLASHPSRGSKLGAGRLFSSCYLTPAANLRGQAENSLPLSAGIWR